MATLEVDGRELILRLSPWEKIGGLHGDVRVPVASVRSVRATSDPWSELRGIRAPGTGIPHVIALGTRRGSFGKDFAAVYRNRRAVVVELAGASFGRLVVGDDDAKQTAARIRDRIRQV